MKDLMQEAGFPVPVFQTEGIFTVFLNRPVKSSVKGEEKGEEKSVEKIMEIIKNYPAIAMQLMAEILGISASAVEKHVTRLK